MAAYIRSWLPSLPRATPSIVETAPPPDIVPLDEDADEDEDDTDTIRGDDDKNDESDSPPSFPGLNSAQRLSSANHVNRAPTIPRVLTDSELMPPPPLPTLANRQPGVARASTVISTSLSVPSAGASLAVPLSTTKLPNKKASRKVALAPGHGPLDWANLKKSGADLRGVDTLMRIPPSVLKQHNKREDAWSAFHGKVYNITPYLTYHPGGDKELMRVAGRDGTKLFALTHGWVNVDYMLDSYLVGFLVPEP